MIEDRTGDKNGLALLFLAVAVLIVYHGAFACGFVYDDSYLIVQNPFIRGLRYLPKMFAMDVTEMSPYQAASGYYRPFSMVFLTLLFQIFKLTPWLWHTANLMLHTGASFLVYLIVRQFKIQWVAALAGALVFAVHTVHVEAVVPVYNYMGVLASFFALFSFYCWMRCCQTEKLLFGLASVALYALAIFSKEDTLVMPLLFFLYAVMARGENNWKVGKAFANLIPFAAVGLLYVAMRVLFVDRGAALGLWDTENKFNLLPVGGILARVLQVLQVYGEYLRMLIWPGVLTVFHSLPKVSLLSSALNVATISAMTALVVYLRREKLILFAAVWFMVTSFLVSNIIPIGGLFAERLMYLPSVAYALMFAWLAQRLFESGRIPTQMIGLAAAIILAAYSWRTIDYIPVWRDNIALWSRAVLWADDRSLPYLNLAEAYFEKGDYTAALPVYLRAISFPQKPWKMIQMRLKLARCYGETHNYSAAINSLNQILKEAPDMSEAAFDLGWTYLLQKEFARAMQAFLSGSKRDPQNPWFYFGLAEADRQQGFREKALPNYQKALDRAPDEFFAKMIATKLKEK